MFLPLRSHQRKCETRIESHLKDNKSGLVKMFCGSGKSLVIYNSLEKYTQRISAVVVPSITLVTQFKINPTDWYTYHDSRDTSFRGYDNQCHIPVNRIISYLETRKDKRLRILDLGCGRNSIYAHYKDNPKFNITGYDHVSYGGSVACDISSLPDADESVDICVYSQSLMGSNWKQYIIEGFRVLRYNGEMIICESRDRYETIREYIQSLGYHIAKCEYNDTHRWFCMHVINYRE
jgi:SAM-dependent methyltransferase